MSRRTAAIVFALALATLGSCSLVSLPREAPPLREMEIPAEFSQEPDDEPERLELQLGSFSGLHLKSAWLVEPDEPGVAPDALEVTEVVENSPAAAAGLRVGDLLLSAKVGSDAKVDLAWTGQWRKLEAERAAGTALTLTYDRAATVRRADLTLVARVAHGPRHDAQRFREEQRSGIVLRSATEVEARRAGLGAGGGAVLIGMSARSPWRESQLRFGDLLIAVDGTAVHDPQVLLSAIRSSKDEDELRLEVFRDGETLGDVMVGMTRRAKEITSFGIPLLFSYTHQRRRTETSVLFGLFGYESTTVAWECTLFWFFSMTGGDRDRLEEVGR